MDMTQPNPLKILFNSEGASAFNIEKSNPVMGDVKVKWVDSTQTYHFKAGGMDSWADTGKKDADKVKNSTEEIMVGSVKHSVKRKLDAGQGLSFESLSPADSGLLEQGDSNGGGSGDGSGDGSGIGETEPMSDTTKYALVGGIALIAILLASR